MFGRHCGNLLQFQASHQLIIIRLERQKEMNSLEIPEFDILIKEITIDSRYKEAITQAETIYTTKSLGLQTLNPSQVIHLINRNLDKTTVLRNGCEALTDDLNETVWVLNEFKLFVWVSVCYAYTKKREFHKFNKQDYEFLHSLFTRKSPTFLEYHLKNLMKDLKKSKQKWSSEQSNLLIKIIKEEGFTFRWSQISFKLFDRTDKACFRTPQKCREKWFNHLDPEVNRNKWTLEEDLSLFNSILTYGTKWALISKLFNGSRTEHMIKNRFNSLAKKFQSKSNRTSAKKIAEKIYSELYSKSHGVKLQDDHETTTKHDVKQHEVKQEETVHFELKNQLPQALHTQIPVLPQRIYLFNEVSEESFIEWEEKPMQLTQLRQFDLDKMLFSQSTLNIQHPFHRVGQVELIEVELFADVPNGDEYLSLLY